jgi:peptidoglycan hydrolase-like protein with peptidoglycan-binding domain
MALFTEVDPEKFIDTRAKTPLHGRGAWNSKGKANGSWRYERIEGKPNIGTDCEKSLDAWACGAGVYAYQQILAKRGYLTKFRKGVFGRTTMEAVKAFQAKNLQVTNGRPLTADGTIGTTDAKALLTPLIDSAERTYGIPDRSLRGETNLESALDTGALGYFIYYGTSLEYRGVDRSSSQINSGAHPDITWAQAFDPFFAIDWSGKRMRSAYDSFKKANPGQRDQVLWDAALCYHNNPSAATTWARQGFAPTDAAASYVAAAKTARY